MRSKLFIRVSLAWVLLLAGCTQGAEHTSANGTPRPSVTRATQPATSSTGPSRRTPSGRASAPRTVSSSSEEPSPDCGVSDLDIRLTVDGTKHDADQPFHFSLRAVNVSRRSCQAYRSACSDVVYVRDSSGVQAWSSTPPGGGLCARPAAVLLHPGETVSVSFTWDQRSCTSQSCPGPVVDRGRYTSFGRWQFPSASETSNDIGLVLT